MPSRNGPVHVATTMRKYKGKVYHTTLLRRTYRQDGKVKHETLGNISHLPPHLIDIIRKGLRGDLPDAGGQWEESIQGWKTLRIGHQCRLVGSW